MCIEIEREGLRIGRDGSKNISLCSFVEEEP